MSNYELLKLFMYYIFNENHTNQIFKMFQVLFLV